MKMQKLDSKQVPQVVILGVLSVGVLGWAGYTFMGGTNPTPVSGSKSSSATLAKAGSTDQIKTAESTATGTDPAGVPALNGTGATPNIPGLQLGGAYNPDPFKSEEKPEKKEGAKAAPKARVEVKTAPDAARFAQPLPPAGAGFADLPGLRPGFPGVPGLPTAPAKPAAPAGPTRPTVAVTGIINAEDGKDMALVELGSEHRIIQEGDMLPNRYKVKRIASDGVVLVNGSDRFFVALGLKNNKDAAAESSGPANRL